MFAPLRLFALTLGAVVALSGSAQAAILYTNFGPGNAYSQIDGHILGDVGLGVQAHADSFTVSSNAQFGSLTMALSNFSGSDSVTVQLRTGSPAGAILETLTFTGLPAFGASGNSPVTVNSVLHPNLTTGTTYWLTVAETNSSAFNAWNFNSTGIIQSHGFSFNGGATYDTSIPDTQGAFSVNSFDSQVATPEPASFVVLSVAGLCLTGRFRRRQALAA